MVMEENEFYRQLVQRYADNLLSEEELEVFFHSLEAGLLKPYLVTAMTEAAPITEVDSLTESLAGETADIPVPQAPLPEHSLPRRIHLFSRIARVAAVLLLLAAAGWWFATHRRQVTGAATVAAKSPDIAPGRNAAILTLSGDRQVMLDSATRDTVLTEGAAIVANAHGRLAYNTGSAVSSEIVNNTLTTSRGGQYQLTLPDGTRVWLNAASSITYPTAFGGRQREVSVSGEAYFDVVKDIARPFRVVIRSTMKTGTSDGEAMKVDVLGTGFNIMAYADEPEIRTTLVQGAIRVHKGPASMLLHPGMQARVTSGATNEPNSFRLISNADTSEAIAWTTGFFQFEDLGIQPIMRQIARWYDADIVYDPSATKLAGRHFGGRISRRLNLSDVLAILEANKIHFRIEGKTVHVLP
jgi:transmembrane sensor